MNRSTSPAGLALLRIRTSRARKAAWLWVMLFLSVTRATAFESNGFVYEILDATSVTIAGCTSEVIENLAIPASVSHSGINYRVTHIGDMAFYEKGIETLDIPDGITHIGVEAFMYNNIKTLKLPHSLVSLNERAFSGNDLKLVYFPPTIKEITGYGGGRLFPFSGGEDNTIDELIIENGDSECTASFECYFKKLTVCVSWSGTCKGITDELSFDGVPVIDVYCTRDFETFPATLSIKGNDVTVIRSGFNNNPSSPLYDHTSFFDVIFVRQRYNTSTEEFKDALYCNPKVVKINCKSLKGGFRLFSNFKGITDFDADADEIEIHRGAFAYCDNLASIDLTPFHGLEVGMFQNCVSLKELKIMPGNRFINGNALLGCSSLKKIEIAQADEPLVAGVGVFKNTAIEDLTLGREIAAYDMPFYNIKSLKKLTLSENVRKLPDYAFAGCSGLKEIYCESSVPPVISPNTFKGVDRSQCKVFIRDNESGYREDRNWEEFFSGINNVSDGNSEVVVSSSGETLKISNISECMLAIYNVAGSEVVKPHMAVGHAEFNLNHGNYIIICGNKSIKYAHN